MALVTIENGEFKVALSFDPAIVARVPHDTTLES